MWDAESGSLIWSAQADAGWCAALSFHPDGSRVSAGYELGQIVEWNAATGARMQKVRVGGETYWQKGPRPIHALAWSQDGQALAAAFGDAVRVYDRNLHSSDGPGWLLALDWADDYT
jgi:WD40 repeat protein